jgi:hypothetical protein
MSQILGSEEFPSQRGTSRTALSAVRLCPAATCLGLSRRPVEGNRRGQAYCMMANQEVHCPLLSAFTRGMKPLPESWMGKKGSANRQQSQHSSSRRTCGFAAAGGTVPLIGTGRGKCVRLPVRRICVART